MGKTDVSILINHAAQGHASHFEEVDLLTVHPRHAVIGVGQTDEGDAFILPILLECGWGIGSHSQDLRVAPHKALMVVPQARQLRAAVRSHEPAQKGEHDRLFPPKIGQAHRIALHVVQFKIGRQDAGGDDVRSHFSRKPSKNRAVASATCSHCSSAEIEAALSPSCASYAPNWA